MVMHSGNQENNVGRSRNEDTSAALWRRLGSATEQKWTEYLEYQYVMSTIQDNKQYDPSGTDGRAKVGRSERIEMVATSFPLKSFLTTRQFLLMTVLVFFNFLFMATLISIELARAPASAKQIRFSWDLERTGRAPLGLSAHASKVGLLAHSCPLLHPGLDEVATSDFFQLNFSAEVVVHGWFLDVGRDRLPPQFQSLRVEAISDSGSVVANFSPPGCWHCFRSQPAGNFSIPQNHTGGSSEPGSRLVFSLKQSTSELCVNLVFCMIFLGLCPLFLWHHKQQKIGCQIRAILAGALLAALLAACMILSVKRSTGIIPRGWLRVCVLNLALAMTLRSRLGKVYQHVLWFCGLVYALVLAWALRSSSLQSYWELQEGILCAVLLASGLWCTWYRGHIYQKAVAEAESHVDQFEAGLKQVEVVDREGLLELSHSAARWAAFHPPRNIRHQIATPVMKRLGAQGILAGFKDVTPKTPQPTVHQLFLQAAVARIFLRSVIEELGSKCGALLPRKTEEAQWSTDPDAAASAYSFEDHPPWTLEPVGPEGDPSNHLLHWTGLKHPSQAIAKACVLYDDDMTRVTDLCRETVVFEQSAHLSAFLDALHAHSSPVVVERVRASHHLPGESPQSSDAAFGTGFRGVVVNLRIRSELARELSVDGHVCEVVLVLAHLARCLSAKESADRARLRVLRSKGVTAACSLFSFLTFFVPHRTSAPDILSQNSSERVVLRRSSVSICVDDGLVSTARSRSVEGARSLTSSRVASTASGVARNSSVESSRSRRRTLQPGFFREQVASADKDKQPTPDAAADSSSDMEAGRDRQESTSPIETRREAMAPCPEEPGSKLAAVEKPLEPCPKRASLQETVLAVLEAAGTERGGARGDAEDQAQGRELVGMRSGGAEITIVDALPVKEARRVWRSASAHGRRTTSLESESAHGKRTKSVEFREDVRGPERVQSLGSKCMSTGTLGGEVDEITPAAGVEEGGGRESRPGLLTQWIARIPSGGDRRVRRNGGRGSQTVTQIRETLGRMWGKTSSTASQMQDLEDIRDISGWAFLSAAFRTSITAERIQSAATFDTSLRGASGLSVFKTSTPLQASFTKRRFALLWGLLAIGFLFPTFVSYRNQISIPHFAATHFRFRMHELRGGAEPSAGRVHSVGLLHGGCMVDVDVPWQREEGGAVLSLELDGAVLYDGFYVVTASDAPAELDPVAFGLEAHCSGSEWKLVGASRRQLRSNDDIIWSPQPSKPIPVDREAVVRVFLNKRVAEFSTVWTWGTASLGFFVCTILAWRRMKRYGHNAVMAVPFMGAVCRLVSGLSVTIMDGEFSLLYVLAFNLFGMCYLIHLRPQYFLEFAFTLAPFWIVFPIIEKTVLGVDDYVTSWGTVFAGLTMGACAFLLRVQVWRAKRLVREDIQRYEELWKALREDEHERLGLDEILEAVEDVQLRSSPGTLCQLSYSLAAQSLDATTRPQERVYDALSDSFYNANALGESGIIEPGNMLPGGSEGLAWLPFSSATRFLGGGHNMIRSFGRSVEGSPQHNSFNSQSSVDDNFPQHRRTGAPKDRQRRLSSDRSESGVLSAFTSVTRMLSKSSSLSLHTTNRKPSSASACDGIAPEDNSLRRPRTRQRQGREFPPWKRLFPHTRPQQSLDNLYVQAAAVQMMLNAKVAEWGAVAQGLCALKAGGFVPWRSASEMSAAEQEKELKRGSVKRPGRAAEKLNRAYGGDASRLLDITRDSMVFEQASQLAVCIRIIHSDDEVEIVGIKNRLSPDYDGSKTFGYRDVALILRFTDEAAERRKLNLHLCELQLLLKDFAVLKNEEGHARYVKLRDARGE